ncbi:hypothetical protein OAG24_00725 [bacterium]|nr:hypothetical protein [bacterium]
MASNDFSYPEKCECCNSPNIEVCSKLHNEKEHTCQNFYSKLHCGGAYSCLTCGYFEKAYPKLSETAELAGPVVLNSIDYELKKKIITGRLINDDSNLTAECKSKLLLIIANNCTDIDLSESLRPTEKFTDASLSKSFLLKMIIN